MCLGTVEDSRLSMDWNTSTTIVEAQQPLLADAPCQPFADTTRSSKGVRLRNRGIKRSSVNADENRAASSCMGREVNCSMEDPAPVSIDANDARPDRCRRVQFDMMANAEYEVIPYSEIYGIHPRDFVFDKQYCMIPALNFIGVDMIAERARIQFLVPSEDDDATDCEDSSDEDDW